MKNQRKWTSKSMRGLFAMLRRLATGESRRETKQYQTALFHPSLLALEEKAAAMQDAMSKALLLLFALALLAGTSQAQAGPSSEPTGARSEGTIVIYVWDAAAPLAEGSGEIDPRLSRDFATSGLGAMNMLREWQRHLAYTIRSGYPLSESWIALDRDRADAALRLAALATSTEADRIALRDLTREFDTLQQWSDALIEANRQLALAEYYMSPEKLQNDPLFQKTTACGDFLTTMLSSGRLAEDRSCQ